MRASVRGLLTWLTVPSYANNFYNWLGSGWRWPCASRQSLSRKLPSALEKTQFHRWKAAAERPDRTRSHL